MKSKPSHNQVDNRSMEAKITEAGDQLAFAAARVCTEYDGIHRLRAALAKWYELRAGKKVEVNGTEYYQPKCNCTGTGHTCYIRPVPQIINMPIEQVNGLIATPPLATTDSADKSPTAPTSVNREEK